jgi:DNA-binding transcriptional MocR family regulator
LFGRIVSDIRRQVAEGILGPGDRVASARQMTEHYSVSIVTAQRAQRELQNQRITFGVQGLGTFVHPDALAALKATPVAQRPADCRTTRRSWATWPRNVCCSAATSPRAPQAAAVKPCARLSPTSAGTAR